MALDKDMEIRILKGKIASMESEYEAKYKAKYEEKVLENEIKNMKKNRANLPQSTREWYEKEIARLTKIKDKQLENLIKLRKKLKMR